jgi:hypothetical protein
MLLGGVSFDAHLPRADTFRGAVAALKALWRRSVNLIELSVIDIGTERALNGFKLRSEAVSCDLDSISKTATQIIHQDHRGLAGAIADEIGNDQFAIGV